MVNLFSFEDEKAFYDRSAASPRKLQASENFTAKFYETLPIGVAILKEQEDELVYLNKAGRELLELPPAKKAVGLSFFELLCTEELKNDSLGKKNLSHVKYLMSICYSKRLGKNLFLKTMLFTWKQEGCRRVLFYDLSTVGYFRKQLMNYSRVENLLLNCMENMTQSSDKEHINGLLESLAAFFEADTAYILKFDQGLATSNVAYEWNQKSSNILDKQFYDLEVGPEVYEKLVDYEDYHLMVPDLEDIKETLPAVYNWCQTRRVRNFCWIQHLTEGEKKGYLCLENVKTNAIHFPLLRVFVDVVFAQVEMAERQARCEYEKQHDWLTGLLNRRALIQYLESFPEFNGPIGVLVVDLNAIELLRYRFGNNYADKLLRNIANVFKANFPAANIYARGENQVVVICRGTAFEQLFDQTQKMRQEVAAFYKEKLAVGLVWNEKGTCKAEQLFYVATLRMLREAKQRLEKGHQQIRGAVEHLLREFAAGRYEIVLQEQVNLQTGKVTGAEALVRYVDQDGKIVLPEKFIKQYEVEGTIQYLDLQVLKQICYLLSSWQERGLRELMVSVKVSAYTIMEPDTVNEICAVVDGYNIPHSYIMLEINEDVVKLEPELKQFSQTCNELVGLGFKLCLDNFGSKYAFVKLLNWVPFYAVKFDGSIIRPVENDSRVALTCKTLMQLCKKMGLKIMGEGVETKAQAECLKNLKCQLGQGYYWGRPLEVGAFERKIFSKS